MDDQKEGDSSTPIYRITVQGRIESRWSDWFSGLAIDHQHNFTILTGPVTDQAALRGILNKLWDLNLILVSVDRCETSFS